MDFIFLLIYVKYEPTTYTDYKYSGGNTMRTNVPYCTFMRKFHGQLYGLVLIFIYVVIVLPFFLGPVSTPIFRGIETQIDVNYNWTTNESYFVGTANNNSNFVNYFDVQSWDSATQITDGPWTLELRVITFIEWTARTIADGSITRIEFDRTLGDGRLAPGESAELYLTSGNFVSGDAELTIGITLSSVDILADFVPA